MEPLFAVLIALIAPLPALRRVPTSLAPPLWYGAGALFIAWGLHVLMPVTVLLACLFLYCCSSTRPFRADLKNPQP